MAPNSWKVFPDLSANKVEIIPFVKSKKFFAVDDSGSTSGTVLKREREFVDHLRTQQHANEDDTISLWGSECDIPITKFENVNWSSTHGGTYPAQILKQPEALKRIQKSDVWFLITDGEIHDSSVHELAQLAQQLDVLNVPIVFVIVGNRRHTPETTNISVGISFFASAQDTLILFKDVKTNKHMYNLHH